MAERTILVTGSTDGIGEATAHALSRQGHRVLLHGRNKEKGRKVLAELEDTAGSDRLGLFIADLSANVISIPPGATARSGIKTPALLIRTSSRSYAPAISSARSLTCSCTENFLAQFLLAHELLGLLERSAPARIVNVASIAHRSVRSVDWGNLPGFEDYDAYNAYAVSKLGIVAFTARLARTLEGTGVTANSLHPGVIDTKLLRAYTGGKDGGAPPERGAEVEVRLALSPDAGAENGGYFEEGRWKRPSSLALDAGVQERFWEMGSSLTGAVRWADPKAYAR